MLQSAANVTKCVLAEATDMHLEHRAWDRCVLCSDWLTGLWSHKVYQCCDGKYEMTGCSKIFPGNDKTVFTCYMSTGNRLQCAEGTNGLLCEDYNERPILLLSYPWCKSIFPFFTGGQWPMWLSPFQSGSIDVVRWYIDIIISLSFAHYCKPVNIQF